MGSHSELAATTTNFETDLNMEHSIYVSRKVVTKWKWLHAQKEAKGVLSMNLEPRSTAEPKDTFTPSPIASKK